MLVEDRVIWASHFPVGNVSGERALFPVGGCSQQAQNESTGIQTTIQKTGLEALTLAKERFNLSVSQQSQWVVKVCVCVCLSAV